MNVFTVVWTSILAIRRSSHQREKQSTHVNKYVYPSQGRQGPVMSMCTGSNRFSRDEKGSTSVCVCLPTSFGNCSQVLAHSRISDFIRGQTYLSVSSLMETLAPGWDRLWRLEKKIRRNESGTNVRIFSVLMFTPDVQVAGGFLVV